MDGSARLIPCKIKLALVSARAVAFKLAVTHAEKQNSSVPEGNKKMSIIQHSGQRDEEWE